MVTSRSLNLNNPARLNAAYFCPSRVVCLSTGEMRNIGFLGGMGRSFAIVSGCYYYVVNVNALPC